ncbi:MAG: thioesterase family protein [Oligoflexia bacterium]|nr:thioesterase family protein [Oligoflexia bacterium]
MRNFLKTAEGTVPKSWIDINGHMNVVHYMALFDQGSDALCKNLGITSQSIAQGHPTLVANRIYISHKRELLEGDTFEVWSGFINVTPEYATLTHRLVSQGSVRASCDIRASAFCPVTRKPASLNLEILSKAASFKISGMADRFAEMPS